MRLARARRAAGFAARARIAAIGTGLLAAARLATRARRAAVRTALLVAAAMAHLAGLARLFRGELVRIARGVCSAATFGGNFALTFRIHRCETAVAGIAALVVAALVATAATAVV